MQLITITGGHPLQGVLRPATAKNSVLPLMAASLLCGGPCRFRAAPRLSDVDTSLALLCAVGAEAVRSGEDLCTRPVPDGALRGDIPPRLAGAMRSSVFYLAPLLLRVGRVGLPLPGGCRLGPRPIDIHLAGLAAMGAQVELEADRIVLTRRGPLHSTDFSLRLPSVGATLTLLMAACGAAGTTVLRGAACEPEITDLADFLRCCGACIEGDGTPVITVRGGTALGGTEFTPLPDRIAAATYAAAAACAGGRVRVEGCRPVLAGSFLAFLEHTGCGVQREEDAFTVVRCPQEPLRGGQDLCTGGWPGFATDTAPLAAAVLLTADAPSVICDALFPNRFGCAAGFAAMGASVRVEGRRLFVEGGAGLHGARAAAPDLRGGAALLLAALGAEGQTTVCDTGHIRRGYADLPADLRRLGADCRVL